MANGGANSSLIFGKVGLSQFDSCPNERKKESADSRQDRNGGAATAPTNPPTIVPRNAGRMDFGKPIFRTKNGYAIGPTNAPKNPP